MRSGAPRSSIRLFQGNSLPWGGLMPKGDEVMEVRKLKTVIAGCGKIFPMHAVPVSRDPHAVLTAVCDVKPERAGAAAERFGCRAYTDFEVMLEQEKPDVVHICTPHYLHVPMAIYSLERNINVFMEKPPAISFDQLEELKKAAAKSEAQLGFCYQNRYNASIRAAKDLIDSGKAGKVLGARAFVTWCRGAAYYTESGWRGSLKTEGGGVLINQSVHTQDLLCFLLGDPTTVDATMTNHHLKDVIEVEDTLEAYIDFNGVHASFYATTSYCADVAPLIEIACENMTIRVEDPHVTVYPKDAAPYQLSVETLPPIGKSYWGTGHTACISDFYQSLRDNRRFSLNLETMEPSIRLMLGTYESARSGHSVTLIEQ